MDLLMKILCIIVLIITLIHASCTREEWVDPHDMHISTRLADRDESKYSNNEGKFQCNCNTNFPKDKSSFHLKKVIRLITSMTHFDRNSEVYKGVIDINLNVEDYDFLRKVLSDQLNDEHILTRMNQILDKSFERNFFNTYFFSIMEFLIMSKEMILLTSVLIAVLYILWKWQPHNYQLTTLFKLFFPLVYVSDFILRYLAKLEEVEVDKFLQFESYKECDPSNLGWIDWMYDKFTGYCEKNKRNFMLSQRAATHIFTPMSVISDQFDILVTILKHLGKGFGSFMWALIEDTPWYVKPFVALLSFLLVIFMVIMLGCYTLGVYPKFNLFYMLQFECKQQNYPIQNNTNQNQGDCLSGENLKILLKSKTQPSLNGVQKNNTQPTYKIKPKVIVRRRISKPASPTSVELAIPRDQNENSR